MTTRISLLLWLVVVWVALWEEISAANVLSGLVVGGVLLALFPIPERRRLTGRIRPLPMLRFIAHFLRKLLEANIVVGWEVITPNNEQVREAIVAVPVTAASETVITLVANAISLTPGTLTVEISRNPTVLYVHVLHFRSVEAVRHDVLILELHALRAIGTPEAVADAERRLESFAAGGGA